MAAFKSYATKSGKTIGGLLAQFEQRAVKALGAELYQEAQGIISQSKQLVPVDTGSLRDSGYVDFPVVSGSTISVTMGYGGVAAKINPKSGESAGAYAIYVHEDLEAHHKTGTAKFLEMPFDQAKSGMAGRIAAGMRDRLKPGGEGAGLIQVTDAVEISTDLPED